MMDIRSLSRLPATRPTRNFLIFFWATSTLYESALGLNIPFGPISACHSRNIYSISYFCAVLETEWAHLVNGIRDAAHWACTPHRRFAF